jgi:hypothetical protein
VTETPAGDLIAKDRDPCTSNTLLPARPGDTELTVRTIRLDNTGAFGHTGQIFVNLYIEDTESAHPDGRPITIAADLSPADARMLAAALVCEAERVEALKLRVTR